MDEVEKWLLDLAKAREEESLMFPGQVLEQAASLWSVDRDTVMAGWDAKVAEARKERDQWRMLAETGPKLTEEDEELTVEGQRSKRPPFSDRVAKFRDRIAALEAQLAQRDDQIEQLEADWDHSNQALQDLRGQLAGMTADRDHWREYGAAPISERDAWTKRRSEQDWQTMIAQVNDVTRQRDELLEQLGHPQERIQELEFQVGRLMEDNTTYRGEINRLQVEREKALGEREEAYTRIKELVKERDNFNALYLAEKDRMSTAEPIQGDEWYLHQRTLPIQNEPYLGLATTEQMFRELICHFKLDGYTHPGAFERALVLAEMLGGLSATEKEYREVDHG